MSEQQQSILALATALASVRERQKQSCSFSQLCGLLDDVEQLVFNHKDAFGVASAKFQLGCEEFVLLSNTIAMQALQQLSSSPSQATRDLKLCGELLQKAEQHTRRAGYMRSVPTQDQTQPQSPDEDEDAAEQQHASRRLEFRLVCLNNLACYHKEIAKPLAALGFLEKALKIQMKQVAASNSSLDDEAQRTHSIALTHLNLCAVLSQLQRHSAAAGHAKSSVALLGAVEKSASRSGGERQRMAQLMLIAHFNLGVELEHLSETEQALRTYQSALQTAKVHGIARAESELVRNMEDIVQSLRLGKKSARGSPGASAAAAMSSPRSRQQQQQHGHRPLSPRSLRQTTA